MGGGIDRTAPDTLATSESSCRGNLKPPRPQVLTRQESSLEEEQCEDVFFPFVRSKRGGELCAAAEGVDV